MRRSRTLYARHSWAYNAILRLSAVVCFANLEDAVCDALNLLLPNVCGVVVYLQSTDGQDLVSSAGLKHTLPKEGPSWEAVQKRKRLIVDNLSPADPVSGLLPSGSRKMRRETSKGTLFLHYRCFLSEFGL
ncbi:hypothetical protein LSAT2_017155 [Lamellibrachia satsuma]|nr:hypothetical protein LSAT2_017155 [Lamellibrachia satsuma]